MPDRLSTGVEVLDRELSGGIPAGSVVSYEAPPASQGELLLYELTRPRPSLYLTTDRTEDAVADAFRKTRAPTGSPDIRYISGEDPLDAARRGFRSAGEATTVIIDPVDGLERTDRNRYETMVNELGNHMENTGSIAILHCLDGTDTPPLRETTHHMADVTLDLRTTVKNGVLESRLMVSKFRGGRVPTETIKLDLSERVRVDTSRDIA